MDILFGQLCFSAARSLLIVAGEAVAVQCANIRPKAAAGDLRL